MIEKSEKYWTALLEQYKLGNISETDRFELEKKALDDPFLFDALEGFSTVVHSDEKKAKGKIFTLPRMAAAASLVFLVAMVFLLQNEKAPEKSTDQSIAMVLEEESNSNISTPDKTEKEKAQNKPNPEEIINKTSTTDKTDTPTTPTAVKQKTDIVNEATNSHPSSSDKMDADLLDIEEILDESMEADDVIVSANKSKTYTQTESKIIDTSFKRSKIISESAGAEETADNNSNPPIISTQKKVEKEPASTFFIVEPAIGKKDFEEFVRESIDNRGLRKESPHKVTIEFDIDKNGELSNFLHIFNGCSECGGYAIHLLSTSGVWKTNPEGQEGRARYVLIF